ncbi:putative coat protein [Tomato apical leaf curl virus]|uniref:Putative coat protein n=1 Tax=Tomato apical leaf curl virus TaxID=2060142 RepID=A0A2H4Z9L4_9GEMI|nr:putative coat protein [Tomato apical leaf curl virus]AUF71981.1 putative coat protein [Tomato apical leaf curl virus]
MVANQALVSWGAKKKRSTPNRSSWTRRVRRRLSYYPRYIPRGPKKNTRDKVYTFTSYKAFSDLGGVWLLNGFAQGLGNNQRNGSVEIIRALNLRLGVAIAEGATALNFARDWNCTWYVIADQSPGSTIPAFSDIFTTGSAAVDGLEYIPDDMHLRFQIKMKGKLKFITSGVSYSTAVTSKTGYNKCHDIVRKFKSKLNVRTDYDSNSSGGAITDIKKGALYLVINPEFSCYAGVNCTMYHSGPYYK